MAAKWLFKDGKLMFSGGKIQFVPNGGTAADCACCGGCSACTPAPVGSCSNCDDLTPDQYEIVLSSLSLCPCFKSGGGSGVGSWYELTLNIAINGAHTVTRTSTGNCFWRKIITNGLNVKQYDSATGCGGTPDADTDGDVEIVLRNYTNNKFELYIQNSYFGFDLFYDIQPMLGTGVCCQVPDFTNQLDNSSDCGTLPRDYPVGGYGGAATGRCL